MTSRIPVKHPLHNRSVFTVKGDTHVITTRLNLTSAGDYPSRTSYLFPSRGTGRTMNITESVPNSSLHLYLSTTTFTGFSIALLCCVPAAVSLQVLTAVALLLDRTMLRPLRLLLLNVVAAEFLTSLYVILHMTTTTVLSTQVNPQPNGQLCRVILWYLGTVLAARMFCITAYSIGVLVFVKYGACRLKTWHAAIAIGVVWILAFIMGVDRWLPFSVGTLFVHQVACVPFVDDGVVIAVRIASVSIWLIVAGLIPTIVCISLPIAALRHLKKNGSLGVIEPSTYKKAATKLALFLIVGSIVNIFWIFAPGMAVVASSFFPAPDPTSNEVDLAGVVTVYMSFPVISLSLFPPSLIIVSFLKSVQQKFKEMFCCLCIVHCCISLKQRRRMVKRTTANADMVIPLTSSYDNHRVE